MNGFDQEQEYLTPHYSNKNIISVVTIDGVHG
jgi:hypothetical protein